MEKETKHTPGEDEQNGPYIFTGGADRISSTVTFEKGHERSLILRKHLSEDRIDNQSIRYKVYDAMEDYKNYELTIPSTELSEMKKEREELRAEVDRLTESLDEWHKKANKEQDDAYRWYTKYNEMSERAFSLSNREHHLISEVDRVTKEKSECIDSLKKIFGYMDSGVLIRDISKDHESDWAIKMVRFQMDLKEAYDKIK